MSKKLSIKSSEEFAKAINEAQKGKVVIFKNTEELLKTIRKYRLFDKIIKEAEEDYNTGRVVKESAEEHFKRLGI
ncbi:hypothetical protein [Thermodesulfovibrio sp.]|uniref:hypothetical protein n=1 Tax=Thermodesulfovibrio sp. TaxID=2067987 RepID=UPI0030B2EA92